MSVYEIPQSYIDLARIDFPLQYDEKLDVYSEKFDASTVLSSRKILIPDIHSCSTLDNISKSMHLIPGWEDRIATFVPHETTPKASSNTPTFSLSTIASVAVGKYKSMNDPEEISASSSSSTESPLELLHRCMLQKARVRVVVRNHLGYESLKL
jgi:hypothetical protein